MSEDMENFGFKPLTQGLGFDKVTPRVSSHKEEVSRFFAGYKTHQNPSPKSESPQVPPSSPPPPSSYPGLDSSPLGTLNMGETKVEKPSVSGSLREMLDSLPPSVDFKEDIERVETFSKPSFPPYPPKNLGGQGEADPKNESSSNPLNQTLDRSLDFDVTLDDSLSRAFPRSSFRKSFHHERVIHRPQFKEIPASLTSAILDAFMALALSFVFVVSLLVLTQMDLIALVFQKGMASEMALEVGILFIGVTLAYCMLSRGLFGSTLGDWAFDVRLGMESQRLHFMYPFQVLFRTLIVISTGWVILPLLSIAFGRDLAYYFSGLKLYCRQY